MAAPASQTMQKAQSTQRLMNSSGGSFKASASDVRASAQEDLDKLSMGSSRAAAKKKPTAPRVLKPLDKTPAPVPGAHAPKVRATHDSDVIPSGSLQYRASNRGGSENGMAIDMGLGVPGASFNPVKKKKQ